MEWARILGYEEVHGKAPDGNNYGCSMQEECSPGSQLQPIADDHMLTSRRGFKIERELFARRLAYRKGSFNARACFKSRSLVGRADGRW